MPVKIRKLKSGKYRVSTPNRVHAKATTLQNAQAQERIIEAHEHTGWEPTGRPAKKRKHALLG